MRKRDTVYPCKKLIFAPVFIRLKVVFRKNHDMADVKLDVIKDLMGMEGLSDSAKTELIKVAVNGELKDVVGATITEKDGLYTYSKPGLSNSFRIVDGHYRKHGECSWSGTAATTIEQYDNGVIVKSEAYSKGSQDCMTTYYDASKTVTKTIIESFAAFPDPGKNVEEIAAAHFQDWLAERIKNHIAIGPGDHYVDLHWYGDRSSDYRKHLPWVERLCKFKGYKLEPNGNFHKLTWAMGTGDIPR